MTLGRSAWWSDVVRVKEFAKIQLMRDGLILGEVFWAVFEEGVRTQFYARLPSGKRVEPSTDLEKLKAQIEELVGDEH